MSRQDRSNPRHSDRLRRWRRRALRALGILLAVAVLLAVAAVLALRAPPVRQAVLRRAGEAVATSTGVYVTARDFALVLRRGELTVDGLELRATPDAEPVLTVFEIHTVVSLSSLLGDRVIVRLLRLEGVDADFSAPLPELLPAEDSPAETAPPAVEVEKIVLTGGAVDSGPLPADFGMWLDGLRADGVEVAGSYRDGTLSLHLPVANVVVSSDRRPEVRAALEARLGVDSGGAVSLEGLKLEADGLALAAEGRAALDQERPVELSFSLQAEPALLLPDLTAGGHLDGTGELTFAGDRLAAAVRLDVRELPAEILRPMIGAEDLELEGTVLDVDADLTAEVAMSSQDDPLDLLAGHAEVAWRRGDEQLVAASLRAGDGGGPGIRLAFEVEVLPGEAGTRRLAGELKASRWLALDEGELAATRFDLEVPDLEAAAARLGLPPDFGGFRPSGEIRASAEVTGPILHPGAAPRSRLAPGRRHPGRGERAYARQFRCRRASAPGVRSRAAAGKPGSSGARRRGAGRRPQEGGCRRAGRSPTGERPPRRRDPRPRRRGRGSPATLADALPRPGAALIARRRIGNRRRCLDRSRQRRRARSRAPSRSHGRVAPGAG